MNKKLSIVIPCYNEINNIERLVAKVRNAPIENKEIIIVDDMSVDGTRDVLENCLKDKVDKIIYHKENSGKGAAVRTGFLEASGDVIIVQDADMEYDPNEYPTIVKPIFDNEAKVVSISLSDITSAILSLVAVPVASTPIMFSASSIILYCLGEHFE
jgi:glycosyltransferase involved in cell wall biosynthesis